MSRGPGKPRLREGDETVRLAVRISATDRALLGRAAEAAGTSVSDLVRTAAVLDACAELGLDGGDYVIHGVEAPTEAREALLAEARDVGPEAVDLVRRTWRAAQRAC